MRIDPGAAWETLPRAFGPPPVRAHLRLRAEDFQVVEDLGFSPSGSGEHLFLRIRKQDWNTADVAAWLARALDVRRREVSFAGRKDRHARTEQWFSVHLPGREPALPAMPEGLELRAVSRHRRKLRVGALRGNRFVIRLREVHGDTAELPKRLFRIACQGVPNLFGAQRFGIQGGNLEGALRLFSGTRVNDRQLRGLYLSAARAFLFNRVLAERIRSGSWNRVLPGDCMTFSGSRSVFPAAADTPADPRLAALDLHPTGPMAGTGGVLPGGEALALEQAVLADYPVLRDGLVDYRLQAERRALRLPVERLAWQCTREGDWVLAFTLAAGSFATAVIREIADVGGELEP